MKELSFWGELILKLHYIGKGVNIWKGIVSFRLYTIKANFCAVNYTICVYQQREASYCVSVILSFIVHALFSDRSYFQYWGVQAQQCVITAFECHSTSGDSRHLCGWVTLFLSASAHSHTYGIWEASKTCYPAPLWIQSHIFTFPEELHFHIR